MSFLPCSVVASLEAVEVLPELTVDIIIATKTRNPIAIRQATNIAQAMQNIIRRSPLVIDAIIQNWFRHCITEMSASIAFTKLVAQLKTLFAGAALLS